MANSRPMNWPLLLLRVKKTATTSAFFPGETTAAVDEYNIILDGRNQPVAVTQTVVSEIMPFTQVSAEHAYHEGEGDQTLTHWRRGINKVIEQCWWIPVWVFR
ncbi:ASCH domain-containing protein [Furfurilactobacillus sp. WILCCON 0119]